jgi:copper chaperone NosL
MKTTHLVTILLIVLSFASCKPEFSPISYGHDACQQCKMTIMDKRYAAEIVTKKGKAFKFDDIACLKKYLKEENLPETDLMVFIADYNNSDGKFLDARQVVYLHSELFKSPMNGNVAAFALAANVNLLKDSLHTEVLKWDNIN